MKRLLLTFVLLTFCAPFASAQQTGGANQLAGGTLAQRPATCKVSRREVYFQTDSAGSGAGSYECAPSDNQWRKMGAQTLDQLTDAQVSSPATNQALLFNGSLFVNRALTKADVGLPLADNTSDASKPISAAQQAALDLKADASALTTEAGARATADTTLQTNVNAEATVRGNADTTLQGNIDAEASARASAITSASTADRARSNHTGTQSADTLTDGTTNKAFLATERTKLSGVATGATANSSDATLLARANHTGTQTLSTISDAGTAAALNVPASGNAASGEVVKGNDTRLSDARTPTTHASSHASAGSDPLTLSESQITNLVSDLAAKVPTTRTVNGQALSGDVTLTTSDVADSSNKRYVTDAQRTVIQNTSGTNTGDETTATIKTKLGVTTLSGSNTGDQSSIVGITGTTVQFNAALTDNDFATQAGSETLTNKTLTTPTISDFSNATHNHTNAAGGGQLTDAALSSAVSIAKGGTGQVAKAAAFDALSPNTTLGDVTYHNGTNSVRLAGNTSATKKFFTQTGNGSTSAAPGWNSIVAGDIPDLSATYALAQMVARISGSDSTTSSTTLVDVTGLSVALLANSVYEFEAKLYVGTSADATGIRYGVNFSAAGATIEGGMIGPNSATVTRDEAIRAFNTSSSNVYLTATSQNGYVLITGIVTTTTNAGNLTIQHLKISSGTSTVRIGSHLKIIQKIS